MQLPRLGRLGAGFDLCLQFQHLAVQVPEVFQQSVNEYAKAPGQLVAGVFNQLGYALGDLAEAFGQDEAEFSQEAPYLVVLGRARLDEGLACTVQGQLCLLLYGLDGHKAHARAHCRLANGRCIGCIVFVALHIGLDVLGRYQVHGVAHGGELACPMVGTAAGLHGDGAGFQAGEEFAHRCAVERSVA